MSNLNASFSTHGLIARTHNPKRDVPVVLMQNKDLLIRSEADELEVDIDRRLTHRKVGLMESKLGRFSGRDRNHHHFLTA